MKAWLLVLASGCFPTRSSDYACSTDNDCTEGRSCDRGFCVLGGVDGGTHDTSMFDCSTFTARHFMGCSIPPPTGALALTVAGKYTYDTDAGMLLDPGGALVAAPDMMIASGRVISVDSLTVGSGVTLRVVGAQPLVIASWSTISIAGTIDASSSIAGGTAAGANPAGCASHAAGAGNNDTGGAGGGAGGGFQDAGGKGGNGNGNGNGGGVAGAKIAMPLLLGGCAGGHGGQGDQLGGAPGSGGGAIQLTALQTIDVTGTIHAGGAGGSGAVGNGNNGDAGGGGGGAGGMIGLDGTTVTVHAGAKLAANGGAGGGGSENNNGANGGDGTASATPATGGVGINAGDGGTGSGGAALAGIKGVDSGAHGGGGGGGAAGFVVVHGTPAIDGAAVVSPAVTMAP